MAGLPETAVIGCIPGRWTAAFTRPMVYTFKAMAGSQVHVTPANTVTHREIYW